MQNHTWKRMMALLLSATFLTTSLAVPAQAAAYNDFEAITSHVNTRVTQKLSIARPVQDIYTDVRAYYLTGGSNPDEALTLNDTQVTQRGIYGSWGAYVQLEAGENVFTLQNGSAQKTVRITRGTGSSAPSGPDAEYPITNTVTGASPLYDVAVFSGEKVTLSCTAPAGATVTATAAGSKHTLKQKAETAQDGVPAKFTAEFSMPNVSGTKKQGPVTYTMTWKGKTTEFTTEGALYAVGTSDTLLVEMKDTSSTLFAEESTSSNFVASAKKGAVDYVREIGSTMYRLGSGGWVLQSVVQPLTGGNYSNKVHDVRFEQSATEERFIFEGTGKPIFTATQDAGGLMIQFAHTSGVTDIPLERSRLFANAQVLAQDGDTRLTFTLSGKEKLWGYVVEYLEDGTTVLLCKYAPTRAPGGKPLSGVGVALDPGHGGVDPGALGIPGTDGPLEKEINFATALAVKKRLESLGAHVILTRKEDVNPSLSERMWTSQQERADFFIALHCNSTMVNVDGLKPNGVEVYYYEDMAKDFAGTLLSHISAQTERATRGARYSNFKVTLNTYAPAVLVEMGFLTNPTEYDSLCSRRSIFNTANAIGDALVASLS